MQSGLAGGLATNGLLEAALAESTAGRGDVAAVIGGCLLVAATAVIAGMGPALRAARMDPKIALQTE